MASVEWKPARIMAELCDEQTRLDICQSFFEAPDVAENYDRKRLVEQLACAIRFRPATVAKMPPAQQARWLARLYRDPDLSEFFGEAIAAFHFCRRRPLMKAFLDCWSIPNDDGRIEHGRDYTIPQRDAVRAAWHALRERFPVLQIALYFAAAGWVMGKQEPAWRTALWPVAEEIAGANRSLVVEAQPAPEPPREDSRGFTTLDRLLIDAAIAAVSETEGALSVDEVEDLVDEVIHLNMTRHHSYFHRSFLGTLTNRPFELQPAEENFSRRAWTLAGRVMAHARRSETGVIASLYRERRQDFERMYRDLPDCACMVARTVFDALWEAELHADAVQSVPAPLAAHMGPSFLGHLLELAGQTYRSRRVNETGLLVNLLEQALAFLPDEAAPPRGFVLEVRRRRAQCLKGEGHFAAAAELLVRLAAEETGELAADILADLGLTKGGFKWLADVEVPREETDRQARLEQIQRGAEEYARAERLAAVRRTNVCYVLGVEGLLRGTEEGYAAARRYLEEANAGASGRVDVYRQTGVLARIRLYLGLAILLSLEESQFANAAGLLRLAAVDLPPAVWPKWLLRKAARNCLDLGSEGVAELIALLAECLPSVLEDFVTKADLLDRSPILVGQLTKMALNPSRSPASRWDCCAVLLERRLRTGHMAEAQRVLDEMETLAAEFRDCRGRWIEWLGDSHRYAPAWTDQDAWYSQAVMCERENRLEEACVCLSRAFHAALSDGRMDEAEGLLERMKGYALSAEHTRDAEARLRAARPVEERGAPASGDLLAEVLARDGIQVLLVGGDERQAQYDEEIREELGRTHARLRVDFEHTGWGSNWGRQLDALGSRIERADAVVVMRFLRTELGRALRQAVGAQHKIWVACTGHGRDSCLRSILQAARQVAQRRAGSRRLSRGVGGAG